MINQLIVLTRYSRRTLAALLPLLFLGILYSTTVEAGVECFFNPGGTVTVSSVTTSAPAKLQQGGGWLPTLYKSGQTKSTHCNTGNDGQDLHSWSNGTPDSSISVGGYSAALYATNVPGIYYAVKIVSQLTPPAGYISKNTTMQTIYSVIDDDEYTYLQDKTHDFYIQLYQDPNYVSKGISVSAITPAKTNTVGYFRYGTDDVSDELVSVSVSNFSIPIQIPSCNVSLSSQNASGSTVNMGNYSPEAISSSTTQPIAFGLSLTSCANASQAVVKLTSNNFDSSTGYMKNTGSDMGVGVKITQASNGEQLKPGGSSTSWTISGSSTTLSMNAQLLKLSETIGTGNFSAQGTFEVTYN